MVYFSLECLSFSRERTANDLSSLTSLQSSLTYPALWKYFKRFMEMNSEAGINTNNCDIIWMIISRGPHPLGNEFRQ